MRLRLLGSAHCLPALAPSLAPKNDCMPRKAQRQTQLSAGSAQRQAPLSGLPEAAVTPRRTALPRGGEVWPAADAGTGGTVIRGRIPGCDGSTL